MKLDDIISSEIIQAQDNTNYIISCICGIWKKYEFSEIVYKGGHQGLKEGKEMVRFWRCCSMNAKFQLEGINSRDTLYSESLVTNILHLLETRIPSQKSMWSNEFFN